MTNLTSLKNICSAVVLCLVICASLPAFAKEGVVPANKKHTSTTVKSKLQKDTSYINIAVFAPIYIDDAFTDSAGEADKTLLPKNILPGLEFYNGVMLAVDSLSKEGVKANISVYDTRQPHHSLAEILALPQLNNLGLVIAAITNTFELKQFAQFAIAKNVPLISATYPNSVGVNANPFFVLLNSSFPTHLDGLYRYMTRFYSGNQIIAVRKNGSTEDFIKTYINELNRNNHGNVLNIKWLDLKDGYTPVDLAKNLDSTKNNLIFVASPTESFGLEVVRNLNTLESYHCITIGMPTWAGIKELNNTDCRNVEIVYSTPFVYHSNNPDLSTDILKEYRELHYSRPSDMAYKGFEITYHFTKLLEKYKYNLINNLSDKSFTLFNQFDIQPVRLRKSDIKPDYLENKKLYFIKKQNGQVRSVM